MKAVVLTDYEIELINRLRTSPVNVGTIAALYAGLPYTDECLQHMLRQAGRFCEGRDKAEEQQKIIKRQQTLMANYTADGEKERPAFGQGKVRAVMWTVD